MMKRKLEMTTGQSNEVAWRSKETEADIASMVVN